MDIMEILNSVILLILALDTVRAVIAMTGFVKTTWKYSWIIYGKYDKNIVYEVFKELGFNEAQTRGTIKGIEDVAKNTGITRENASMRLISIISKNIVKFDSPINYGGKKMVTSSYYINTMEAVQNVETLKQMTSLMYILLEKYLDSKPDFILAPKRGNTSLAQSLGRSIGCPVVLVKDENDKSKAQIRTEDYTRELLRVNYEGANNLLDESLKKRLKGVIIDCNVSGGSQILNIVEEFSTIIDTCDLNIEKPKVAYVLFRADTCGISVDDKFKDHGCSLFRYFDLNESIKEEIYGNGKGYEHYSEDDRKIINNIINKMKTNKIYYM